MLLRKGADVNSRTQTLATPLHLALSKGNKKIAGLLFKFGGNLLAQDAEGNTPVHYAVRYCSPFDVTKSICSDSEPGYNPVPVDIETLPEYLDALKVKNNKGLIPREMVKIELQQVVNKLAYAFFERKSNTRTSESYHSSNGPQVLETRRNSRNGNKSYLSCANSVLTDEVAEEFSEVPAEEVKDFGHQSLELYEALKLIGNGSFGEVYLVKHKRTKELFAMKVIHKLKIMSQNIIRYVMTEKRVMAHSNHPFIVKLRSAFQTKQRLFLVMDYCPGGDLSQCLLKEKRFTEDRARIYLAELTLAIESLHKRNIIFRDLKPDNVVMDGDGHVLLTDFGLSKEGIDGPEATRSFCGSIAYLAPEILKRSGHGKAVDWYLLGVLLYEMLVGQPPYFSQNREEIFHNIMNAPLKVPSYVSHNAKSLMAGVSTHIKIAIGEGSGEEAGDEGRGKDKATPVLLGHQLERCGAEKAKAAQTPAARPGHRQSHSTQYESYH